MSWSELTVAAVQTWPSDQTKAIALAGSHSPNAASSPTTRNCWPKLHCFLSTNLTRTVLASGTGTVRFTRRANVSLVSFVVRINHTTDIPKKKHTTDMNLFLKRLFAQRLGVELIPSAATAGGRFSAETMEFRSSSPTCSKINRLLIVV